MESTRSWFHKFQPRVKNGPTKTKEMENAKDARKSVIDEAPSNATKQKAAAAKQYIENHYKSQMKCLQDRKERYVFQHIWPVLFINLSLIPTLLRRYHGEVSSAMWWHHVGVDHTWLVYTSGVMAWDIY